jgi:hypothetical protein
VYTDAQQQLVLWVVWNAEIQDTLQQMQRHCGDHARVGPGKSNQIKSNFIHQVTHYYK